MMRGPKWKRRFSSLSPWMKHHLLFSKAAAEMEVPEDLRGYSEAQEKLSSLRGPARELGLRLIREKWILTFGLSLMLLGTLLSVSEPWIFGLAIDKVLRSQAAERAVELRSWALLYFGIIFTRMAVVSVQLLVFEKLGQKLMLRLRVELFSHLLKLPVSVYDHTSIGKLVTRVSQDVSSMNEMFSAGIVSMVLNLLTVIGIVIWVFVLSPKLGLISLALFVLLMAVTRTFTVLLTQAYRNTRGKLSALNAFLAENLMGMRILQLFGRESIHFEKYTRLNSLYAFAQMGTTRLFSIFQPTLTLLQGLTMALVMGIGVVSVTEGEIPLGVLVSVFAYVQALFQPMRELAEKWNLFLSGMASAERVFSILSWKTEPEAPLLPSADESQGKSGADAETEIRFEDVWFAYSGEDWVLKGLSFEIPAGTSLGIVGHTGAGKSTVLQLLLRFYEPQRGRILLGGKDLRSFTLSELRARFGLVQQEAFLFSGSLLDNVLLPSSGKPTKSPEDVRFFLTGLGMSADRIFSEVEERGVNRSAGEKQLVAFARAWARDPAIWVLDEATAHVDSESEKVLDALLQKAASGKTRILIAHRLATLRNSDQILVLNQGQKSEMGNHLELMKANGLYAHWVRYQSLSEEIGKDLVKEITV